MSHHKNSRRISIDIAIIAAVAVILLLFYIAGRIHNENRIAHNKVVAATINKNGYSITNPNSIWVVVNKKRPITPLNYIPQDLITPTVTIKQQNIQLPPMLRMEAAAALSLLFNSAKSNNINLSLTAGYVPYTYLSSVYNGYLVTIGQVQADTKSTRPGYDEAQVGLSVNLAGTDGQCINQTCFANTPEGKWLASNSYKYGFILRYPNGKQDITGYRYEPWYFRYVGTALAKQLYTTNQTMEEFFNLPPANNY